jgi:hypothetical protein
MLSPQWMALLVIVVPCHGFASPAVRPWRGAPLAVTPQLRTAQQLYFATEAAADGGESPVKRFRAWFSKYAKFDKDTLAKSGVDAFFTYGVVSNLNAALTLSLAWGAFSRASGLSPLIPGQWKSFLAVYVGIYATVGTLMRPFRFALAIGLTPVYSKMILLVRGKLPFYTSNPKLNRSRAPRQSHITPCMPALSQRHLAFLCSTLQHFFSVLVRMSQLPCC